MKQSLFTMEHARQLTADTYELVLSGAWTFDKFAEMARAAILDVNGDGTFDKVDNYGYAAYEFRDGIAQPHH